MSFSKDVKNELARVPMEDMAILHAELAAYVRTCGVIRLREGPVSYTHLTLPTICSV